MGELTREVIGDRKEEKSEKKRRQKRSQKREDGKREMGALGSCERSPGSGTQWLDPRGGRREFGPSGWMGSRLPQHQADTGIQRGLLTPSPWKRNHRLPDVRDSGTGTGRTHGPELTGASGVPEARRVVGSCGVSGGVDWTRGRRVRLYKRATWEGLSLGLSEYYNSPGRLAVFRRKFDSVVCQDGEDPAAFATKLEILAVRGFGDVGPQARTRMARDRFISEQRSCGLRHHLDSVPLDTPIQDIVDRCRVWESHSYQNRRPPLGTNVGREHPVVASDLRECSFYTEDHFITATSPAFKPKVPVSVVHDVADDGSFFRGEWDRAVSDSL